MQPAEYLAYCDYFIADYGREIAENFGHSLAHSTRLAGADLCQHLPGGVATPGQTLLCLEAVIDEQVKQQKKLVGYLWHAVDEQQCSFIYDFYVLEEFRGHGFGKLALRELERQLRERGIDQIKLRVAFNNKRALQLYQEMGFNVTGYNLAKSI